jgi:hypothetical protein
MITHCWIIDWHLRYIVQDMVYEYTSVLRIAKTKHKKPLGNKKLFVHFNQSCVSGKPQYRKHP